MGKLKQYIKRIVDLSIKAVHKGALDIIVSSMLNKVFILASNVLIIRLMDQQEYGIFTYAYNVITIIMIVSSLGIDTAMMQFCCEDRPEEERLGIARFTLPFGIISNLLFSIGTFIYALLGKLSIPEGRTTLMALAFILPFPCILNYQKYWLRINKKNREFGLLSNIASASYLAASVLLIYLWGINGTILGRYLGFIIPIIIGIFFTKTYFTVVRKAPFPSKTVISSLIKYGLVIALTNGISELLYYLDVYVVGLVTADSLSIAYYKSATVIPRALASLPAIIMIFVYPYFAFNKEKFSWVKKHVKMMQFIMLPLSCIVTFIFFVIAPWMIEILYGADYLESLVPFRILVVSFIFSATFRVISGNILAMLGRVKENLVMGIVECSLNIVLDYFLVKYYGSTGAAIATLSITIVGSLMCTVYLYYYLNKNIKLQRE